MPHRLDIIHKLRKSVITCDELGCATDQKGTVIRDAWWKVPDGRELMMFEGDKLPVINADGELERHDPECTDCSWVWTAEYETWEDKSVTVVGVIE